MRSPALLLGFLLLAGSAHAQANTANPAVNTSRQLWEQLTGYITTAAQDTPESLYAYRPTPQVRSFGQLIGHLAGSQNLICGTALGEPTREEDAIEKNVTGKAELVAALKASTANCARAYAQTDQAVLAPVKLFGQDHTRLYALMLNATHNGEHYGNIVTYLRLNGIVPPSSRPRP
jgi:uncharacterized damage-inducible protein DinB